MTIDNIRVPQEIAGLLTTREAGQRCGRHQRTIVSYIRRGLLPALKLPGGRGQYFVEPSDVDKLMARLSTPTPYIPEND